MPWSLPAVPASAGALIFDGDGRLLILKPTYKSGWTVPGGVIEADGESPWDACRREVFEETGLRVTRGRLACVDTRPAKNDRPLGLRFLFDCGAVDAAAIAQIRLQREIGDHRFVPPARALTLLRPAVRRRVAAALDNRHCLYLENGRRVRAVR